MEKDKVYLVEKYGGEFKEIGWEFDIFWQKPKYTLPSKDLGELCADQILECVDCDMWRDITYKNI